MKISQTGFVPLLIAFIVAFVFAGGYVLYKNYEKPVSGLGTVEKESRQPLVSLLPRQKEAASAVDSAPVTYSNPEYGISFSYPAKYSNNMPAEYLPFFQYKDPQKPNASVADSIDVRWLPIKQDYSPEQALMDDVVYDGSGAHPKSFDEFELIHLGENDFYRIKTGLFEAVLGYRYYLIKQDGAFVFNLVSNRVPWTDPSYEPEKDIRHLELQQILKTVRLNN